MSTSTIRRYLRAGRFPNARQEPSPLPGQPGRQWRIPTEDVLAAGLGRHTPASPDHAQKQQSPEGPAGAQAAHDRIRALEHALELERTRRQAAEVLAAERARTILTLEIALRALEDRHPEAVPDPAETATSPAETATSPCSPPGAGSTQAPRPLSQPGVLQMVRAPRRLEGELGQEDRAAIIERALNRQQRPKRRWWWQ